MTTTRRLAAFKLIFVSVLRRFSLMFVVVLWTAFLFALAVFYHWLIFIYIVLVRYLHTNKQKEWDRAKRARRMLFQVIHIKYFQFFFAFLFFWLLIIHHFNFPSVFVIFSFSFLACGKKANQDNNLLINLS